jgi:hypothetical protein
MSSLDHWLLAEAPAADELPMDELPIEELPDDDAPGELLLDGPAEPEPPTDPEAPDFCFCDSELEVPEEPLPEELCDQTAGLPRTSAPLNTIVDTAKLFFRICYPLLSIKKFLALRCAIAISARSMPLTEKSQDALYVFVFSPCSWRLSQF